MLGLYGFLISLLLVFAHLSSLESFKVPYLAPYNISDQNRARDLKDTILRFPIFMQTTRPIFAREMQKIRLRLKNKNQSKSAKEGTDRGDSSGSKDK